MKNSSNWKRSPGFFSFFEEVVVGLRVCVCVCARFCVQQEMELMHLFCVTANVACRENLQGAAVDTHMHKHTYVIIHMAHALYTHTHTHTHTHKHGSYKQTQKCFTILMHAHTHMHSLHVMFLLGIMGVPTLNTLNIKGGISAHICCWNRVENIDIFQKHYKGVKFTQER